MTTPAMFTEAVAWELKLAGIDYDHAALAAWVADVWPWAEDDPDPHRWAREYAKATATTR